MALKKPWRNKYGQQRVFKAGSLESRNPNPGPVTNARPKAKTPEQQRQADIETAKNEMQTKDINLTPERQNERWLEIAKLDMQKSKIRDELKAAEDGIAPLTPGEITQEEFVAGQRPIQEANINLSDPESLANQGTLLGAGLAGMGAGALKGAAIGTTVAPGIGTAIGGVVGAIAGTAAAVYTKTTWTNVQDMGGAFGTYTSSAGNIDWIINEVNSGRMKDSEAWTKWDEEVGKLHAAQTFMKTKTDDELDKFTAPGAITKMAKIDAYIRRIDQKERNLAVALAQPDPSKIINAVDYGLEQ